MRHHHLSGEEKARLQLRTKRAIGLIFSKLAGLYCYFLGLTHEWMTDGGIAGWLIPSEFMDVNYGEALKRYLLNEVTLLHIHRFDPNDVQFTDAIVSSAIVWFRKIKPPKEHSVIFTFGGTLFEPRLSRIVSTDVLNSERKWTRFPVSEIRSRDNGKTISDFFQVKRGIATGANNFFILSAQEIADRGLPMEAFRSILPSSRYIKSDEVMADENGLPEISPHLFLLDIQLSEAEIRIKYPTLFAYLEEGKARGVQEGYLCKQRKPWYAQENRPPAPIICTYLGRGDTKSGRPFRFILNKSNATIANVYLAMYPKGRLAKALKHNPNLLLEVWKILNSFTPERLLGEGRVYGGGLHKLEPKELANVGAREIDLIVPASIETTKFEQLNFFETIK